MIKKKIKKKDKFSYSYSNQRARNWVSFSKIREKMTWGMPEIRAQRKN